MSAVPRDPTKPNDPLVIPRQRPPFVTLAGVLLYGGGVFGGLAAAALLTGAGTVVDDFQTRAIGLGVTGADALDVATALRSALLSSGCGALALAVLSVGLGWGVLARHEAARIGALVVAAASLGCGLVRTSVTAFGRSVDWSMAAGHSDPLIAHQVAQAFAEAMPGWLVGLGGGLTDLQSLSYIAVAALLIAPASREYFRTRIY
jgi:hypothetical protein